MGFGTNVLEFTYQSEVITKTIYFYNIYFVIK